ncbi:MAG: hypothetical protein KKD25_14020 [Gammaproteobacteria bacterium]|nr:hypothetical protein [Gammaproteobacteria bacterium]MBU0770504.1 hypothetical protein [Gammaproteobacteria bacterium]MBU0857983.1 hypothetical protein [Gammaproteobacteria bacterium]MBU1846008.1 hypothetical protein [Gammaproteobacteria bacterium]
MCAAFLLTACASRVPAPAEPEVAQPLPVQAGDEPEDDDRLLRAIQAAHPRTGDPARARELLDALLAADDAPARLQRPFIQSLLEQLAERQRLGNANQRLTQQLERVTQQGRESQQRADELQRKIDALTDIERSLPARAPSRGAVR